MKIKQIKLVIGHYHAMLILNCWPGVKFKAYIICCTIIMNDIILTSATIYLIKYYIFEYSSRNIKYKNIFYLFIYVFKYRLCWKNVFFCYWVLVASPLITHKM